MSQMPMPMDPQHAAAEPGDSVVCPCGERFEVDEWQVEDGPCLDGFYHCFREIAGGVPQKTFAGAEVHRCCGCHGKKEYE